MVLLVVGFSQVSSINYGKESQIHSCGFTEFQVVVSKLPNQFANPDLMEG